jgi:hypothetical protein
MKIDLRSGEVCLQDNQPVRLSGASGLHVVCTAGIIWITVNGEVEDIFLTAGERYRVSSNALTLIESIGSGKVRLLQARRFSVLELMRKAIQNMTHTPMNRSFARN